MAPKKISGTETAPTTPYDGCGMCLVGVRRLSRVKRHTNSPEKQMGQILKSVVAVGGHIIAWADDWEVSGATDPFTRPSLGPWLRGERGPFDGLAAAAVDRVGRDVYEGLRLAKLNTAEGRILITADHAGVWDLTDIAQEMDFTFKLFAAQMEHRQTKKRVQDETARAVEAGQVNSKPSYGYRNVRDKTGKITGREFEPGAQTSIQEVARRILADTTGKVTGYTEAARLTRAGVLSPDDWRAVLYGREPQGKPWKGDSLKKILISENALGFRMYKGRPLIGEDGRPIRIGPELWNRATHEALKAKLAPTRVVDASKRVPRAPSGALTCSGRITCGNCNEPIKRNGCVNTAKGRHPAFRCEARAAGIPTAQHCKPAPAIGVPDLESRVERWFLERYGSAQIMIKVFDPGTGYANQIAELKAAKVRLQADRDANLYEDPDDAEWFQTRYRQITEDIAALRKKPERSAGWHIVPSGKTVAQEWAASDGPARREMLDEHGVKVTLYPVWGRGRAGRVIITAEVAHDPAAEVTGAVDGDPARPEAGHQAEAPTVGRTTVRLGKSAAAVTGAYQAEAVALSDHAPEGVSKPVRAA
ncbi:recombinase family protein [Kitasatospora sp. NPDC001527]|uniref:recombinase family protein n=1 Tax=Kitasatospora sp. NPDC001527 TaxID=3154519 RepID=UPI003323DD63